VAAAGRVQGAREAYGGPRRRARGPGKAGSWVRAERPIRQILLPEDETVCNYSIWALQRALALEGMAASAPVVRAAFVPSSAAAWLG